MNESRKVSLIEFGIRMSYIRVTFHSEFGFGEVIEKLLIACSHSSKNILLPIVANTEGEEYRGIWRNYLLFTVKAHTNLLENSISYILIPSIE